jgi:YHS domain-containing protein
MKLWRYWILAVGLLHSIGSFAGSSINTLGSTDGIAIGGYDTVAFFTAKKATKGASEFMYEWMGAKWLFATQSNLDLFKENPEQYAPQYGGNCALGASEGYVSSKPTNGVFEIYRERLYLFPPGSDGDQAGARTAWWKYGGGPYRRVPAADKNWPKLKEALEAK